MPKPLLNKRYMLISQLGRGGMGVVYKAADTLLGNRFVAVKEMSQRNLSLQEGAHASYAFKREALLLASLSHQSLPRIYDHFSEHGHSYLVMDFIEGETLAELLQQSNGQGFLVEEVLFIGEQLCSVLDYLHTRHPPVIFRDLKPANVMITFSENHFYLIDFGIARFFKTGQLRDTFAFGTHGYASPEQYGSRTTERSDIYSLGVMLHQLLTGLDPSASNSPFSFPPIRTYRPQTPPALETLIMQMVEMDPANRPASMLVIKQELQRIRQERQHGSTIRSIGDSQCVVTLPPIPPKPPAKTSKVTPLCIYRLHSDSVHTLSWSPDGKHIASGGRDKAVHLWNTASGDKVFTYTNHLSYIYSVAWSPDAKHIASTSFGSVHVWDATYGDKIIFYRGHSLWVYAVTWSPDGQFIASAGADGEMHLWNAPTGSTIYKYQGYPKAVRAVAWSTKAGSAQVVSACDDTILRGWNVATGNIPIVYQGHSKEVSSVAWSRDDTKIVSGSRDKTVKTWDAATGQTLFTYKGHAKDVLAVAWSPDGRYIASAGEDKTVHVWDAVTGNTLYTYKGHVKDVLAVAWSPDGTRIASAGEDKTVHVWQIS